VAGTVLLFGALARLLVDAGERDRAVQVLSVGPASLDGVRPVVLRHVDPTGSLAGATQQALAELGGSPKHVSEGSVDLDAALRAALEH
jgi:hypothetical protein